MLQCEGYKMFEGSAEIRPLNGRSSFTVSGVWLFRPDTDCWYVDHCPEYPWGGSFPAECVVAVHEKGGSTL